MTSLCRLCNLFFVNGKRFLPASDVLYSYLTNGLEHKSSQEGVWEINFITKVGRYLRQTSTLRLIPGLPGRLSAIGGVSELHSSLRPPLLDSSCTQEIDINGERINKKLDDPELSKNFVAGIKGSSEPASRPYRTDRALVHQSGRR